MIENSLTKIYDGLFELRDSMDQMIRQLKDVQKVLDTTGYWLGYVQDDNCEFEAAAVRIMLKYLKELETKMIENETQIGLMEYAAEAIKDKVKHK